MPALHASMQRANREAAHASLTVEIPKSYSEEQHCDGAAVDGPVRMVAHCLS